ncbi:putative ABC-type sulfate transporter [Helianthus annuus]|nr:putative ABC-type sulfate transporter [Helianthus annuus]
MTLLLGPPGSGKTTLLKALAGKLENDLRVTGKVTYCGHEMNEFVPQRTCAYISQHDLHHGELTVRETLDFSGRCAGVGTRYEMLAELSRREKAEGIKPDPELDAFMKAIAVSGQKSSLVTEYVLRVCFYVLCYIILFQLNNNKSKMPFSSLRFAQFCDFRPKVCFSASGSKRFEILPFSSGLLTPSIFLR